MMAIAIHPAAIDPTFSLGELSREITPIDDVDRIYKSLSRAYRDLDAYSAAALYTRSALQLTPDRVHHRGRREIRNWYFGRFGRARENGARLTIRFVVTERGVQNGGVYDSGVYVLTGHPSDDESPVRQQTGRFVAVFRRTSGASWNYRIDSLRKGDIPLF
jgi:ketosteroid isomerase-like protein